jgi:hypothetical protein
VSASTDTNEHCLPDAGFIDMPFPFLVRATETAGLSLGKVSSGNAGSSGGNGIKESAIVYWFAKKS